MRKKGWIILTSLVVIVVIAVIGGKIYMDNQKNKKVVQQTDLVKLVKNTFKDVKEIKIVDFYESSPGVKNIDFYAKTSNGKNTKLNSISSLGSYTNNGLTRGKTEDKIHVIFLNDEKRDV